MFEIPLHIQHLADDGIAKVLEELSLTHVQKTVLTTKTKENTIRVLQKHARGTNYYCAMRGFLKANLQAIIIA